MLREAQKMKEILPLTNGLFGHMDYTFRAEVTKQSLDIMFISDYGERNPAPIIELIQSEYGEQLSESELTTLSNVILEMYKEKWDKIGAIYDIEYDPIHNYLDEYVEDDDVASRDELIGTVNDSITYGKTISDSETRTDNLTRSDSKTSNVNSTRTDNLTETETRNLNVTTERTDNLSESTTYGKTNTVSGSGTNSIFGFNSSTAVGADSNSSSSSNTSSGSDTVNNTGTRKDDTDDTGTVEVKNTGTQATGVISSESDTITNTGTVQTSRSRGFTGSDSTAKNTHDVDVVTKSRDRSGTHSGNIGNLTSQKMILEEINLWKWNYMREILNDVKEFCTLPVYLNATKMVLVNQQD